ncbi:hypothetical protein BGX30_002203 [Mortierella sp. GBA39]|nr:hypothetical protein BGX30_002203 [Mortierella sp. GBA39]
MAPMTSFVPWAAAVKVVDGQQQEHVSFPSFVKQFKIHDKDDAVTLHKELLESPRIKKSRQDRLKANYTEFVQWRLHTFWSSWEKEVEMEIAQKELKHASTAVMAQQASLQESSEIFGILQAESSSNGPHTNFSTVTESDNASSSVQDSETEIDSATERHLLGSSRAKLTPFYELIAFIFKSAKGKPVTLPNSVPRGLSKNHEELYCAALAQLRAPGPVEGKKEIHNEICQESKNRAEENFKRREYIHYSIGHRAVTYKEYGAIREYNSNTKTLNKSRHLPHSPSRAIEDRDIVEARKLSANSVLTGLLEMKNPSKTPQHYKTYMRLWKDNCDLVYNSDSIVNASEMLDFFTSVVFKRTVKKYIDPNAGFNGVVGMKSNEVKGKSTRLQQRRPGKWTTAESREEDPLESVLMDMEAREQKENDKLAKDRQVEDEDDERDEEEDVGYSGSGETPDSDNDEDGDVDEADQAVAEEEGAQISNDLRGFMISSVEEKTRVVQEAQTDVGGRKFIWVPVSYETVDSARKSLIYLWRHQAQRTATYPNPASNPRQDAPLRDAIDQYEVSLVYDQSFVGSTRDLDQRVKSRTKALNSKTQIDSTAAVMRTCEVYSTKVTHSGRHAGTSEVYRLNLSLDHIRHLGRWNPIIGAFYMAHFNKPNEPYLIERDLVTPPLELQRLIFPWIERSFDLDDPGKPPSWIAKCDQEMLGVDESVITDDDIH